MWPENGRANVHWLSPAEARRIEQETKGLERIVAHLELRIGLCRIEVLWLRMRDVQAGYFNILGKGKRGGKWRSNPFDPATTSELNFTLELRDAEIAKARSKCPNAEVPEELLIYERGGRLYPYKGMAVDKSISGVSEPTGVPCSNQVLRGHFAKELRLSDVPISTISELLGHSDEKTTRLYLGIDMDDKSSAMVQAAKFRAAAEATKMREASKVSEQSEISVHEIIWLGKKMPRSMAE